MKKKSATLNSLKNTKLTKKSIEDLIKGYSSTESELRETISYLIEHRQMIRNVEIERLEAESATLLKKIEKIEPPFETGRFL